MTRNRDVDVIRLKQHLKALRLPTIQAECTKLAQECLSEGVDHLGFLLQLCELELIERERKGAARRLKAACLPTIKLISEFDFAAQPTINRLLVLDLMRCDYINKRENVLLIGASGTGKTHVATSLAVEACSQGKRVRFYRVTDLVTQLLEAREERQLSRIRGQLSKLDLLVLDELGYVPMGKAGAELLFDVMSRAYERMSLIVTTNLPFENWTEVLDNERLTGATLDRLTHRCQIVETGGESYRLKDARRGRRPREVYKPEAESAKGPEQTPVYKDRPGA
jgi:DNA replication protein DnaC